MQGDSIDHSLQPNRLLQRAGSLLVYITFCPWNSRNKITPFRMHGCSISTSFCCLKSFFLYGLVNTDLVTHTHTPPYSVRDTKQYRPRAIDPDRSQIWAGDRLVLLPKQLKPRRDLRWFVFAGRGININSGKRKSSLRRHSESTGAKSHTDVLS